MKDNLPNKPLCNESAVVNLDNSTGNGTHWVAYKKRGANVNYFDSFGNLKPPMEILKYLHGCKITYNHDRYQEFNSKNCGHLCLQFLME